METTSWTVATVQTRSMEGKVRLIVLRERKKVTRPPSPLLQLAIHMALATAYNGCLKTRKRHLDGRLGKRHFVRPDW